MERLRMMSQNITDLNVDKLLELFPQAGKEVVIGHDKDGKTISKVKIDFEVLRQELSDDLISDKEETLTSLDKNYPKKLWKGHRRDISLLGPSEESLL